jgi:hypothetical protein
MQVSAVSLVHSSSVAVAVADLSAQIRNLARIRELIGHRSGTLCLTRALKLPPGRIKSSAMIRIAITEVAYNAIASTLPKLAVRWPMQRDRDKCFIQVEADDAQDWRKLQRRNPAARRNRGADQVPRIGLSARMAVDRRDFLCFGA